jgi:pyruvate/2-oxoglutarate dehydrogenase complex dihydrolipoamide dehydrogenase (E3) component
VLLRLTEGCAAGGGDAQLEMAVSKPERFETLVVGSGGGGKYLAWHMAKSGRRTAVVERRWIGGSCPNINCLPSKSEIWSAKVANLIHHTVQFATNTGSVGIDMTKVRQRKREMVESLITIHLRNYEASGAALIMAPASLWRRGRSEYTWTTVVRAC